MVLADVLDSKGWEFLVLIHFHDWEESRCVLGKICFWKENLE